MDTQDDYNEFTRLYIDTFYGHKTIASRIDELQLSPKEEPLFERFLDPITMTYFNDTPVAHNECYYDLSTLLRLYKGQKKDPYTGMELKLANFQPARALFSDLDDTIRDLNLQRAAEGKVVEVESASTPMRLP